MKISKFIAPFIFGLILFTCEFPNSKFTSFFPIGELFAYLIFILLLLLLLIYLIQSIKAYNRSKEINAFIYPFICLVILVIVIAHNRIRALNDESESLLKVGQKEKIEGREDLLIDFKKNGSLKISAHYKFNDSYFWGDYIRKKDTLLLKIRPNFPLGKKAVFTDSTFKFVDDTSINSKLFLYQQ